MPTAERRTAADFAVCMRELKDLDYPKAERIRVVLDNLSPFPPTMTVGTLADCFGRCSSGYSDHERALKW